MPLFLLTCAIDCTTIINRRRIQSTTIEEIRHELGMSQEAFAQCLGMSRRNYILRIQKNSQFWTIQELLLIHNLKKDVNIELEVDNQKIEINLNEII